MTAVANTAFDPLSAVDKLRQAGIADEQARAIVDSIRDARASGAEHLAARADVARLEGRIGGLESRLKIVRWVVRIQAVVLLVLTSRVLGLI